MVNPLVRALLLQCALTPLLWSSPAIGQEQPVSLTIYGDGRVMVRRTVPANVPRGRSTHRLVLGRLDPTTLFSLDRAITIINGVYLAATDQRNALESAVGRSLRFVTAGNDTISATVLETDPEIYRLSSGGVVFGLPGRPIFTDSMVQRRQVIEVSVQSDARRSSLPLGYFTSGAQWHASYHVVLGRNTAWFTGSAAIFSERLNFDSAEIRLITGWVSRLPRHEWLEARGNQPPFNTQALASGSAVPQSVGHTRLYALPGLFNLRPGAATLARLFPATETEYERDYFVAPPVFNAGRVQNPNENQLPVEVSYLFKRPRGSELGDRPLPAGSVRLYLPDAGDEPVLVGEGVMTHTPPGEDIRIGAGNAFELVAKRIQQSFSQTNSTTTFTTFQVTLRNASDSAVVISVLENQAENLAITESSVPVEPFAPARVRMRVPVPARGEAVLTYTLRIQL